MKSTTKGLIFGLSIGVIFAGSIYYFVFGFSSSSEFDSPTIENSKIIPMFDEQLEKSIGKYTQSIMHPGYLETSHIRAQAFLNTISKLETYSRYGVTSTRARNAIELRIILKDGRKVEKIYTGLTSSHVMPPPLLMSVELDNGKTKKVLTNGVEKKGSPDWIIYDLSTIIESAIGYDITVNRDYYFGPTKTLKDFKKEWDEK